MNFMEYLKQTKIEKRITGPWAEIPVAHDAGQSKAH
jgi:hypothetical protein